MFRLTEVYVQSEHRWTPSSKMTVADRAGNASPEVDFTASRVVHWRRYVYTNDDNFTIPSPEVFAQLLEDEENGGEKTHRSGGARIGGET